MANHENRVQAYLNDTFLEEIKERAEKNGISLSKYITRVLEDHMSPNAEEESISLSLKKMELTNKAMFSLVIGSTHNQDLCIKNKPTTKEILAAVEAGVAKKMLESN